MAMSAVNLKLLAEGKVSSAIDIYEVYRALFLNEKPEEVYEIYCDPQSFFSITHVTPAFRQYIEGFLAKLSRGESEVYLMPALMGAGKSHFLAFILHLLALYRRCNGVGDCVSRELSKYGIDIKIPSISKVPNVAVFKGRQRLGDFERRLRETKIKDDLRSIVRNNVPLVIIFDETQFFEIDEKDDFVAWIQTLAEVVHEIPGVFLFVSYSLFATEEPELGTRKSTWVTGRGKEPIRISLDTVSEITAILRRWGGIAIKDVDLVPLKGLVSDEEYKRLNDKFKQTYPVNPKLLDILLMLANESLVKRTRIQLTRELLRILARAYLNTNRGELITFAHLPEPNELLIPGGDEAAIWTSLLQFYKSDVENIKSRNLSHSTYKAALSMLRYVLLMTYYLRLMPIIGLYPSEQDLLVGSYNDLDTSTVVLREALNEVSKDTHVTKIDKDKYIYWFLSDETQAVYKAAVTYSDIDGLNIAVNELVNIIKDRLGAFSRVLISGVNPRSLDKVVIIADKDSWQEKLSNSKESILAVDIREFGIKVKRNNLVVMLPNDEVEVPSEAVGLLKGYGMEAREKNGIKSAVVDLGRIIKAIDEVSNRLLDYFPDLFKIENESLKREIEGYLRNRLNDRKSVALATLRKAVNTWLSKAVIGFKEQSFDKLDSALVEISKRKGEVVNTLAERVFNFDLVKSSIKRGNFEIIDDLWNIYLNNSELPSAPISFDEFLSSIKDYCKGYRCVFRINNELVWIPECSGKGETLSLDENSGVAPIIIGTEFIDWPVRQFLEKLHEMEGNSTRYYIKYRRPSGEEVEVSIDDALTKKGDWPYFTEGCFERRIVKASIKVLVDGVEQLFIERLPGTKVNVEVIASEEMGELIYGINGTMNKAPSPGVNYRFEVEVPKEPGEHALSIEAVFKSGIRDQRTVTIYVKGRRRECIKYDVSLGDVVKRIKVLKANDTTNLLKYLWGQRKLSLTLRVSTEQKVGENEIKLNANFRVKDTSYNNVLRLLMALTDITPTVEAVFEFLEPIVVDDDMAQKFKGWNLEFTVICEE
ncbi:hypothetical protein [Caldivirga sp. MU80]|uniref:hypothetical protein n=1 Tax=Caldivirga sp. MU80 TaxID=1650354 RepID=UPI0009FC4E97|nr:hypothetical protein [Caldivirga sp. MU80]